MSRLSKDKQTLVENYDQYSGRPFNARRIQNNWRNVPMTPDLVNGVTSFMSNDPDGGPDPVYWRELGIPHLNTLQFGCKNDGVTDDTEAFMRAIQVHDEEGLPLVINPGMGITINEDLLLPDTLMLVGSNPYAPLAYRTSPTPKQAQNPMCRIKFNKTGGVLFEPAVKQSDGYGNLKLVMYGVGITYQDFYFADSNNNTSATVFKNVSLSGHSLIQNSQINTFNTFFDTCSFGAAVKMTGNTFREIGEYFLKRSILGDAFIYDNYFNGSAQATNGAIGFDITNLSMAYFMENWFEFFNTALRCDSGGNVTIGHNIFDYTYKPIEGFGFQSNFGDNVFNHCNKTSVLGDGASIPARLRRVDANHPMRTEEWVAMNITSASRGVAFSNNNGQGVETMVKVSSSGSYSAIKEVNTVATDRLGNVLTGDKLVNLVPPTAGSIGDVQIQSLMFNRLTQYPTTNLFNGRTIIINGVTLIYNQQRSLWTSFNNEIPDYGGVNVLPPISSSAWTRPGASGVHTIAPDGYSVTMTATAANQLFAYSVPYVQGDDIQVLVDSVTVNVSGQTPILEVRALGSAGETLETFTVPLVGGRIIEVSKLASAPNIANLRLRFGGSGSTGTPATYTFTRVQVYKKIVGSYVNRVFYGANESYRATSFLKEKQLDQNISGNWTFASDARFLQGMILPDTDGSMRRVTLTNGEWVVSGPL